MNKHPFEIEKRALDAEIERLKKSFEQTSLIAEQLFEKHLAEKDAEIERLKVFISSERVNEIRSLLTRAADALEKWCVPMRHPESKLIAELRKAAE